MTQTPKGRDDADDAPALPTWTDTAPAAPSPDVQAPVPLFDPARPEHEVGRFVPSSPAAVDAVMDAAREAFPEWCRLGPAARFAVLDAFLDEVGARAERIARTMTAEQGKTLRESRGEVAKALGEARFMLGEVQRTGGVTRPSENPSRLCLTERVPLGAIAAINPWNFPVSTPMRKLVPALATGNTIVLKPSELTPGPLALLVEAARAGGVPRGVIGLALGGAEVGTRMCGHAAARGVTFTGSTATGRRIARTAADGPIPLQLEMGGKNAAIVCESADLDAASDAIAASAILCSGQRCTAISRVIVHVSCEAALVERLRRRFEALTVGPGDREDSDLGPLASRDQLERVAGFVERAVGAGAERVVGGHACEEAGYGYRPTILANVADDAEVVLEEVFGPVVTVQSFGDPARAIAVHDAPRYGLAAAIFSNDHAEILELRRGIDAGMIFVNAGTFPENHMPFAGTKLSALGAPSVGSEASEFFTRTVTTYLG